MTSARRALRSTEEHFTLGLPVLFSELLVFKWTPWQGFPTVSEEFRESFERMQEVENLENELRVFFLSYDGALEALENFEVRKNTFKFLDQYGTIEDILKIDTLRMRVLNRLVPEYLEERIRNQQSWFRGDDKFSLAFAKEFLRRKFCTMRISFRAPQPTSPQAPVPPPRKHRSGSSIPQPQPSTSQAVSGSYTASGRLRRNSAPVTAAISPPKPRRMTAEELPSPPPTPPALRASSPHVTENATAQAGDNEQAVPTGIDDIGVVEEEQVTIEVEQPCGKIETNNNIDDENKLESKLHDQVIPTDRSVQETAM